jgi:putative endopeptidase
VHGLILAGLALAAWAAAQSPAAQYQTACMDTARIDHLGSRPLGPMLQQVSALQNPSQLAGAIGALQSYGIYAAFALAHTPVPPRPYVQSYAFRRHVTRLFELLGYPHAAAVTEAVAAIGLETTLPPSRTQPEHLSLAQLQKLAPAFDWTAYFAALGEPAAGGLDVADPARLRTLNGNVLVTPLAAWKSYLRWRWLDATALLLSPPFVEEQLSFYARVVGAKAPAAPPPRARLCAAAGQAYPADAFYEVPITPHDYFGDTLALRGWAARQSFQKPRP